MDSKSTSTKFSSRSRSTAVDLNLQPLASLPVPTKFTDPDRTVDKSVPIRVTVCLFIHVLQSTISTGRYRLVIPYLPNLGT